MIFNKKSLFCLLFVVLLAFPLLAKEPKKPSKKEGVAPREAIEIPVDPKYKNRILSVGGSFGVIADMGMVGATITNSGTMDVGGESLSALVGMKKIIMPGNELATIFYSSKQTNAGLLQTLSDYKAGGALIGADLGFNTMVDFIPYGAPVYLRFGVDVVKKLAGGNNEWTLGKGPDLSAAASGYPVPEGGFEGGKMKVHFDSLYFDAQFSFGGIWGVPGKGKVYAGLGLSYMYGNLSFLVDADKKYVSFLTSLKGHPELLMNEPIKENIKFSTHGITGNMELGAEVTLWGPVSFFAELYMSGAMKIEYSKKEFSPKGKKFFTTVMGGSNASNFDSQYMERLASPVMLGGTTVKIGVKCYVF